MLTSRKENLIIRDAVALIAFCCINLLLFSYVTGSGFMGFNDKSIEFIGKALLVLFSCFSIYQLVSFSCERYLGRLTVYFCLMWMIVFLIYEFKVFDIYFIKKSYKLYIEIILLILSVVMVVLYKMSVVRCEKHEKEYCVYYVLLYSFLMILVGVGLYYFFSRSEWVAKEIQQLLLASLVFSMPMLSLMYGFLRSFFSNGARRNLIHVGVFFMGLFGLSMLVGLT